ncbi:MAG TPA: hypothetical protein VK947_09955 [Planococcus sp. (in: firmicutes)]|nr:hypothetical protein [Planococcus sp. (in: firmicutes)]
MKNKSYLRESVESYVLVFTLSFLFFAAIIFVGEAAGQDWSAVVPDLSWEMVNTWSEILDSNA